jgi:hypothetical protein
MDVQEIFERIFKGSMPGVVSGQNTNRCSQMLNISEIAQDADINQKQAKGWLQILEILGIVFYLHSYSNNLLKRLVKTPKLYFYDTGLVCYLTKWTSAAVLESGAIICMKPSVGVIDRDNYVIPIWVI